MSVQSFQLGSASRSFEAGFRWLAVSDVLCAAGDCVLKQRSQPAAVYIIFLNFLYIISLLLFRYLCVIQYVASKIDFSFFLNITSEGSWKFHNWFLRQIPHLPLRGPYIGGVVAQGLESVALVHLAIISSFSSCILSHSRVFVIYTAQTLNFIQQNLIRRNLFISINASIVSFPVFACIFFLFIISQNV